MSKEYRFYFNEKFYLTKFGYWVCTKNKIPWAHRWVWINTNGPIPPNMDIHHIDENKGNNEIGNLQCVSRSDHLKIHFKNPVKRAYQIDHLTKIRTKAHDWLRSKEGRRIQSEASKKGWKKRNPSIKSCIICSKEYETFQPKSKFCSQKCDKKWRRKMGCYNVESNCPHCGRIFFKDKFTKKVYCSISCGAKSSSARRGLNKKI